jgi:hypothetical protein
MKRARRYYVIFENDKWRVKLEKGRVVSVHRSRRAAVNEAKRLGRSNDRPVMVNYKSGATGAVYYSQDDLQ